MVKHGENGHLRQKGKVAELAIGYGGSVGALKAMGALDMGLEEEELQPLVDSWRTANPNIVRFWWDVDRCVKDTVKNRVTTETHGMESLDAKLEELQQELLKRANAGQDYKDLADKIDSLREKKQKVMAENAEREGQKQRINEMGQ